jgi:hypothetical protein
MTIYWVWKTLPELRDLEPSRRKVVWRACCWRPFHHWQTWVAFLSQFVFYFLGAVLGAFVGGSGSILLSAWLFGPSRDPKLGQRFFDDRSSTVYLTFIFGFVGVMIGTCIFTHVYAKMIRPYLKSYLESHD